MKKISKMIMVLFSLASLGLLFWSGCNESPTETGQNQGANELQIEDIVVNPIAPVKGDTVMLTAVVTTGSYADVDYPEFNWEASAGSLLTASSSQVKWASPGTSRLCGLTVTASNSLGTVSLTKKVFVTEAASLILSSDAATMIPVSGDSLYYLYSTSHPGDIFFGGFIIYLYENGSYHPVTFSYSGLEYAFSKDRSFAVHQFEDRSYPSSFFPIDIILDDLSAGTQKKLTQDMALPQNQRRYRYEHPAISPTDPLIVFQGFHPDLLLPDQGAVDTFNIFVYDKNSDQVTQVTQENLNVFPSFSSDGSFLTFISDRDTTLSLEVYAFPVVNGSVDTSLTSLVQLSYIGSWIPASIPPEKPFFMWNPSPSHSLMAIIDVNGDLRLIGTDGGTFDAVQGIDEDIIDMAWSPDGTKLAVIAGTSIYLVGLDLSWQLLESYDVSDVVADITWSSDGQYLIYNVQRAGEVWMQLADISGTLNLEEPLNITNRLGVSTIEDYRQVADIRPRWMSLSSVYALAFGSNTPGVMRLDLSGLTR